MPPAHPSSTPRHQIVTHQDVVHRLSRGQCQLRPVGLQVPPDLLRPEVLVLTLNFENRLDYLTRCSPWAMLGATRSTLQARWPSPPPSIHPLLASLATDPVSIAHRSKAPDAAMGFLDEPLLLFHDMSLRERHRPPPVRGADCNPCPFTGPAGRQTGHRHGPYNQGFDSGLCHLPAQVADRRLQGRDGIHGIVRGVCGGPDFQAPQ